MDDKRQQGRYYTTNNPFNTSAFYKWKKLIPNLENEIILEPFAGANNIPAMLFEDGILNNQWACFDIKPDKNRLPQFNIEQRDTLKDFPTGFRVAITNPPYLAKNSATRRKLDYPKTEYDDLYKLCLEKMLNNCDYVAAIIPETFITSGLFHDRLFAVVSLTCRMFDDTECPVCLALFIPKNEDTFVIYNMDKKIGEYKKLMEYNIKCSSDNKMKFNDKTGVLGINCIDNTNGPTICFVEGNCFPSNEIKSSSRAFTRVSGIPSEIKIEELINECNKIFGEYRKKTKDVFLSSYKGLRKDGLYRRRLDFNLARNVINQAIKNIQDGLNNKPEIVSDDEIFSVITTKDGNIDFETPYQKAVNINYDRTRTEALEKCPELVKKIKKHSEKYGIAEEIIIHRILHDPVFAYEFSIEPGRQTIHQRTAAKFIKRFIFIENFKELKPSGKDALYIKKGKLVHSLKEKDTEKNEDKSIDFSFEYSNKVFYLSHKYTKDDGGSQDNQYKDQANFCKNAFKSKEKNIYYIALCDGEYWNKKRKNKNTRIEQLNKRYQTDHLIAMSTNDLEKWLLKNFKNED